MFDRLATEPKMAAEVRARAGAPRLILNGEETFPLAGWSWSLRQAGPLFRRAGVRLLHPVLGLNAAWPEPGRYDFAEVDRVFAELLALVPDAVFLPRVLLDPPEWWKDAHADELVTYAAPLPEGRAAYRPIRRNPEGGWLWGIQTREPSLASTVWRADMEALLRALLRHLEASSLAARVAGYQVGAGIYGEWHYYASQYCPDVSAPMQAAIGPVPCLAERQGADLGLLRDPATQTGVIEFYRRLHEDVGAATLLHFAAVVKQETERRVLCGAFYTYLLENVFIQEAGHLAPRPVLESDDIDFLASPYSYQRAGRADAPPDAPWAGDVTDGAGNVLGRSRGLGGDGGYRPLLESLKRHGKLYFVEIDPTTFLEPRGAAGDGSDGTDVERELYMIGGDGSDTVDGTLRILRRDLGKVLVQGNGGWLFDFGPVLATRHSWYRDERILAEVRRFHDLGALRPGMDLTSAAQIAAVYDTQAFFATRHWRADGPAAGPHGFFTRHYLMSQSRALHRVGAPVDFLYRFDLTAADLRRYRLLLMVNTFLLSEAEIAGLRDLLRGSGVTVVWCYAPGFLGPDGADVTRIAALTGMEVERVDNGSLLIETAAATGSTGLPRLAFGVDESRGPRFAVTDPRADVLGRWQDGAGAAFARSLVDGWTSVYVGTAPLPPALLRWLAAEAGAPPWSDAEDMVLATRDAALWMATGDGERRLRLPRALTSVDGGAAAAEHVMRARRGDVLVLLASDIAGTGRPT